MDIEITYDPMDDATELMLRKKEQLVRDAHRPDTDSLRWRVEQRGVQKWVILSRNGDPKDIVFEYPKDFFETLKDSELQAKVSGQQT